MRLKNRSEMLEKVQNKNQISVLDKYRVSLYCVHRRASQIVKTSICVFWCYFTIYKARLQTPAIERNYLMELPKLLSDADDKHTFSPNAPRVTLLHNN